MGLGNTRYFFTKNTQSVSKYTSCLEQASAFFKCFVQNIKVVVTAAVVLGIRCSIIVAFRRVIALFWFVLILTDHRFH